MKKIFISLLVYLAVVSCNNKKDNSTPTIPESLPIVKSIKLIYPGGGEVFNVKNPLVIKWETQNIPEIDISVALSDGIFKYIKQNVKASDKSYIWTVPREYKDEKNCFIRINDSGELTKMAQSNPYFSFELNYSGKWGSIFIPTTWFEITHNTTSDRLVGKGQITNTLGQIFAASIDVFFNDTKITGVIKWLNYDWSTQGYFISDEMMELTFKHRSSPSEDYTVNKLNLQIK